MPHAQIFTRLATCVLRLCTEHAVRPGTHESSHVFGNNLKKFLNFGKLWKSLETLETLFSPKCAKTKKFGKLFAVFFSHQKSLETKSLETHDFGKLWKQKVWKLLPSKMTVFLIKSLETKSLETHDKCDFGNKKVSKQKSFETLEITMAELKGFVATEM